MLQVVRKYGQRLIYTFCPSVNRYLLTPKEEAETRISEGDTCLEHKILGGGKGSAQNPVVRGAWVARC